ncbi:MAG: TIGR00725 family protein [Candidatus Omnitrophica bacterium]|nr:TIGR00725 family protein [Candidatus Omnitrophota bacterium]
MTVSVVGAHSCGQKVAKLAGAVGRMVAELDCVLVCGGLGGVMAEACRGAKEAGGLTIGILPGREKTDANPWVDIALPSTIGFSRNVMIAASADVVVALPGSYGTESEICYARVYGRPVINLGGWKIKGLLKAKNISQARKILARIVTQCAEGGK